MMASGSASLKASANSSFRLIFVGCSTYVEIWSAENYEREIESEDADAIRAELEMFGL